MIIDMRNLRRLELKRGRIRVCLNGLDVTDRCVKIDTRRGVVRLVMRNYAGEPCLDVRGRVATQDFTGKVKVSWNGRP